MKTAIENSTILDSNDNLPAEKRLSASEARFRRIFEESPLGMAIAGADFVFFKANRAFCRMLGYSEQEITKLTFKDITHPDHLAADVESVKKLRNGQIQDYQTEKRYIRKNRDIVWASVTISAFFDAEGRFLYFLSMVNDITERKWAEIELKRINEELKEHDRVKNEFVSTVSHELRTPLCVFKNVISNTLSGVNGPVSAKLRKSLEMANQNIDRLSRIVNEFLDVAKIEAGKMQLGLAQVDIQSVIRHAIDEFSPLALSNNLSIDAALPDKDVVIEANRDKLVQVLINLIGNAAKFVRPGGHILVTLKNHNDHISIAVHDDGPGIDPKYIDKIFDRFEMGAASAQSDRPGTGLGLNISKELIEMHHGRIWAESIFGHGSTFTFTLPKKQPAKN